MKRLKDILERHNVEVIETVTDDTDVSLPERCNIANKNNADYFVSIHANADGKGYNWTSVRGWEIHIVGKGGKAEKLAKAIHKHSIPILGLKDRGVRISNFQVLRDTNMPAVLIEHGFYTNKEECEKLKSDAFRQKCAEADAKGILEYLGINYVENKVADESSDWGQTAWEWACDKERKYFDGTNPKGTVTREMLAQVLFNLFGKEK